MESGELIYDVLITDIADKGKAVGRSGNRILFIDKAVPGDVVDVRITKKRATYAEARVVALKQPSSDRVDSFCEHFGTCGGCKWQDLHYPAQLAHKQKQVYDAMTRIARATGFELLPILPADPITAYRNRLDFAFSNKKWLNREDFDNRRGWKEGALGFHLARMFDKVLDINRCWLQDDLSNRIRNETRDFAWNQGLTFYDYRKHTGYLRSLILRNTLAGAWMAIVVFDYEDARKRTALLDFIASSFPEITSLVYVINTKKNDTIYDLDVHTYKGMPYIVEELDGLSFRISPKSFFQTNTRQALALYRSVLAFAGLSGTETVYDLYTGTGAIAGFLARACRQVIGIDSTADAIGDARINATLNHLDNVRYYAGDTRQVLNEAFMATNGRPDVIVTDPPRAGMDEPVIKTLLQSGTERIVYVSCNPATQARDIALLSEGYRLVKAQPVDMFPHTHHVENVALLVKAFGT